MDSSHILIFIVYGLAFFSLGLVLALEAGRTRGLPLGRYLWPLAVFGLLHGLHEWLELFQKLGVLQEAESWLSWFRIGLLAVSFGSLVAYGVQVFRPPKHIAALDAWVSAGLLTLYAAGVLALHEVSAGDLILWQASADALSRYMLGIPGALLAWRAMVVQARRRQAEDRPAIARNVRWMAAAFLVYAMAQVFVPESLLLPSRVLNTSTFLEVAGFPVQLVRAAAAAVIALASLRATQFVEQERRQEVETAHRERLAALEQVQMELTRREALRRESLRHIVEAQEEERGRIARELHDETSQTLTALSLQLAALENALPADYETATDSAATARQLTREMAESIKRLIADLRPAQLDDLGLTHALSNLADDARPRLGLDVFLTVKGHRKRLDPRVETVLYRIAQEALTNVARHAEVSDARLSLAFRQNDVCLKVTDQGCGFQFDGNTERLDGSWGLAGMRERAESVGSTFTIETYPGAGTTISVCAPLEVKEPAGQPE